MLNIVCIWHYRDFYPQSREADVENIPRALLASVPDDMAIYADNHQCILVKLPMDEYRLLFVHDLSVTIHNPYLMTGASIENNPVFAAWVGYIPDRIVNILQGFGINCITLEQYNTKIEQDLMEYYRKC